jgi:hypothetical protein
VHIKGDLQLVNISKRKAVANSPVTFKGGGMGLVALAFSFYFLVLVSVPYPFNVY